MLDACKLLVHQLERFVYSCKILARPASAYNVPDYDIPANLPSFGETITLTKSSFNKIAQVIKDQKSCSTVSPYFP